MKVLVVTNMYPSPKHPYFGIFVKEQVESLRFAGVDVDVFYVDGVSSKLNYFKCLFPFWRTIFRGKYDLIHAHYVFSGWVSRMQWQLPLLVTSHGSDTLGREGWLLRKLSPLVDTITVTSEQNRKRVGLPDADILPCAVDTNLFVPQDRAVARSLLGWNEEHPVMLYVGRDAPLKRLDIIKEAHVLVNRLKPGVELVLATAIPHEDIPIYMNAADVFVFASETEGAPVVIKEAMACNLPIVSVNVGDVVEATSGMDGFYLCDRTPESMAENVLLALKKGRSCNGRELVCQKYSQVATAEKIMALYERVLARSGRM